MASYFNKGEFLILEEFQLMCIKMSTQLTEKILRSAVVDTVY